MAEKLLFFSREEWHTYNPKHNDQRFDVANSGHIDMESTKQNIYGDCYTGFSSALTREKGGENDYSFERVEQL